MSAGFDWKNGEVSPAPAGIAPPSRRRRARPRRLPRARGDCPQARQVCVARQVSPPRPRGLPLRGIPRGAGDHVSPAPAGIAPTNKKIGKMAVCLPRARGDCPFTEQLAAAGLASPPRPRGLPLKESLDRKDTEVSPAPAGIAPFFPPDRYVLTCLPRARGDCPTDDRNFQRASMSPPRPRGLPCG